MHPSAIYPCFLAEGADLARLQVPELFLRQEVVNAGILLDS